MARIEGSGDGNALLLMSHYDSAMHSSPGASDAASGVATILEGLRAYLASGNTPENDIIILFTDAEELGLNGADLFVEEHPWAKEVGIALNFESRGSGGNSFMLLETNDGNKALIDHFSEAGVQYPVPIPLPTASIRCCPMIQISPCCGNREILTASILLLLMIILIITLLQIPRKTGRKYTGPPGKLSYAIVELF